MGLFDDKNFKILDQNQEDENTTEKDIDDQFFSGVQLKANQLKIGDQTLEILPQNLIVEGIKVLKTDDSINQVNQTPPQNSTHQEKTTSQTPVIDERFIKVKVISVGGGGGNALDYMIKNCIESVEYICANTDKQDLNRSLANCKLQLGKNLTQGLGAGSKPEVGYAAAMESTDDIQQALEGTNLLFITAGMGGGTGTQGSGVVAEIAKNMDILTVAVVTKPFDFEGQKRRVLACDAVEELKEMVDSLIVVPNERLLSYLPADIALPDAFEESNKVLYNAVSSIVNLLVNPGFINVDYADVETVMSQKGLAIMGTGEAKGKNRAACATQSALENPLIEEFDFSSAKALLVNVSASADLGIREFHQVGEEVKKTMASDANLIVGVSYNEKLGDALRVSIIATGYQNNVADQTLDEKDDQTTQADDGLLPFSLHVDEVGTQVQRSDRKRRVNERCEDAFLNNSEKEQDIPAFLRKQAD